MGTSGHFRLGWDRGSLFTDFRRRISPLSSQPIQVEVRKKGGCLSGCGTFIAILLVVGLAITYWYVAIPVAVLALVAGLVYWNYQRSETPSAPATTPDQGAARLEEASRPERSALPSGSGVAPTQANALEQLAKLGELRDSGVISEAEFEAKKAELLRRI